MSDKNQNDLSETQPYSSSDDLNKTQPYQNDSEKTQPYDSSTDATEAYETEDKGLTDKTTTHNLGIGDTIKLNKTQYEIIDIISGDDKTGEAVIYKIKDTSDKIYALKLYFEFRNHKFEPNPEALKRIGTIDDPDILKLYDYGTGPNKYLNKFCFEICEFASGGDLLSVTNIKNKYTPDFLKSNVIPEIYKGINRLHQNKIYHCDLKPQNVFFLDKEQTDLVIGDYGSAKTFEQSSEKSLAQTSIAKGTDYYLAPEQARGVISEKNDFYSLGMILLHLLYPEQVSKSNLRRIVERQFSSREIIDFDPQYGDLNQLIAGLTLQDISRRWGQKEVDLWFAGESVEVQYTTRTDIIAIKLGHVTIKTETDLVNYIETDKKWYEDLIEDNEGYGLLLTWVSNLHDLGRKKIFDKMIRYYQQDGKEYVKEAILRYFSPERPVIIEMKTYNFFSEENLKDLVDQFFKHLDDIWKITDIKQLKFYLFQFEFSLRELEKIAKGNLKTTIRAIIDKISSILKITPKEDFEDYQTTFYAKLTDEKILELFYAFDQNRVFKDLSNNSHDTIEKLGFLLAKNSELFDNRHLIIERKVFLNRLKMKNFQKLSYNDFLFEVFNDHIKSEIKFCNIVFNKPDNGDCTIHYRMGKSLSDFFSDNSIKNEIAEISNIDEKIILKRSAIFSTDKIFNNFIREIESKHRINEQSINKQSILQFKDEIKNNIQIYNRNQTKLKIKQIINFIDFPFFVKSFSFLIPIACFILIMIASNDNNTQIINFLLKLSFFKIEFGNFFDNSPLSDAYGVNFLFLISFLPSTILTWKDIRKAADDDKLWHAEVYGPLLIAFLIASPIIGIILYLAIFIVIGIVGGIIAIISDVTWNEVSNFMDGLFIFLYVGTGIIILFGCVYNLFISQKKIKPFPFLASIFLLIFLNVTFFDSKIQQSKINIEPKVEKSIQTAIITVRSANIRSGPSSNYQVVDNAKREETVEIISKSGDWYLIRHNGKEGYIYKDVININNK